MRRYDSYKDSGVEWLGKVPSHWEVKKMKFLFQDTSIKNKPDETLLSVTQNRGVIPRDWLEERTVMPSGSLETFKFIEKDDFAISLRSFEGGLEICHHDGIISPAYTVLKYNKKLLNNGYYKYLFKCQKFISEMQTSIVGIREGKNISYEELKYSFLPIPQTNEQQKISQFLDDKTAKIDQAVDLAEKQIALLKEHKQILIQNAVTRGLNPDVPLKDSGVEWIRQVPEHWDVKKLKFVSKINQHTLPENTNGSLIIKYVDIGSVSFENGIEKVENFSFKNAPSRARRLANKGDIVVSTVRTYLKAITMVKEEYQDCIFSTGFAVVTSNECLKDSFFELYAKSDAFTEQVSVFSKGMSYPAINSTDLSNLWITVPPLSEQQKIADYLDTQTAKIDQAIALKTAHIEKLKEYKNVLINDVVTGKVRV